MIEGDTIASVSVNSKWKARLGAGCELRVTTAGGHELFVIRTELDSVDDEVARWNDEHVGARVARSREITSWPLAPSGRQVTLDVELEGGFRFEADLIETPERVETPLDELETEWTFEGVPGIEMGEQGARRDE